MRFVIIGLILLSITTMTGADDELAEGEVSPLQTWPALTYTFFLDGSVLRRSLVNVDVITAQGEIVTFQCAVEYSRGCNGSSDCAAEHAAIHTGSHAGDPNACSSLMRGTEHVLCGWIYQGAGYVLSVKEVGEEC
jgi:hypothetical protein